MKILIPALVSMACVFSSAESMAAADLILHGGKVYTAEPGQGLQQAVAIENGKVLAVGSDEQVLRLKAAGTRVVDLQGKVLMPGFIDSHSHTVKGGLQMLQANLDGELLMARDARFEVVPHAVRFLYPQGLRFRSTVAQPVSAAR